MRPPARGSTIIRYNEWEPKWTPVRNLQVSEGDHVVTNKMNRSKRLNALDDALRCDVIEVARGTQFHLPQTSAEVGRLKRNAPIALLEREIEGHDRSRTALDAQGATAAFMARRQSVFGGR